MRILLSSICLFITVVGTIHAEDRDPGEAPTTPGAHPTIPGDGHPHPIGGGPGAGHEGTQVDPAKRRELMNERMELMRKLSPFRQEALQDPEVKALRENLIKAQKALQDKMEAIMATKPGYAELKAKMDDLNKRAGFPQGGPMGGSMMPGGPMGGVPSGHPGQPGIPASHHQDGANHLAPGSVPANQDAPKVAP